MGNPVAVPSWTGATWQKHGGESGLSPLDGTSFLIWLTRRRGPRGLEEGG